MLRLVIEVRITGSTYECNVVGHDRPPLYGLDVVLATGSSKVAIRPRKNLTDVERPVATPLSSKVAAEETSIVVPATLVGSQWF